MVARPFAGFPDRATPHLQRFLQQRRHFTGHAHDAQAIGAVGCHIDIDYVVAEMNGLREIGPRNTAGRQNHDTQGILTEFELSLRAKHSLGHDTAQLCPGDHGPLWNFHAHARERSEDSFAHVFRPADNRELVPAVTHAANGEPFSPGVRFNTQDFADYDVVEG